MYDNFAPDPSKPCAAVNSDSSHNIAISKSETCAAGIICSKGCGCNGPGGSCSQTSAANYAPAPVCGTNGDKCDTALGPIPTDPAGLSKALFSIVLSLAGGIAVLLIIFSGYRIVAAQGNPEHLQGAREQLTAAIVGLIFVILAFSILKFIGVDLLSLNGQ